MTARQHVSALAWLAGALLLAPIEIAALGSARAALAWTAITLLAALGAITGAIIAGQDRLISRLRMGPNATACLHALPAVLPLGFVAAHLFDGGMASSLPGARWGFLWVPALGTALTAAAVAVTAPMLRTERARQILAVVLVAAVAMIEYGNRRILVSEYPDVHAFLVLAAVVMAGTAVHLGGWLPHALSRSRRVAATLACIVAASAILVLWCGLDDPRDRWTVATHGMHTRQMARLVRAVMDRDGDGYAAVLGGGDCDDGNPTRSPGAADVAGNGRDEDCDGMDAPPAPAPRPREPHVVEALQTWQDSAARRAVLDETRGHHLVLIAVDALRADMLAPEHAAALPNLHALARESRQFSRAFSLAAGTDLSLATLLTARVDPFATVPRTLIEALSEAGFVTHAVIPREVLRWAGKQLTTRGLASYDRLITDGEELDVGSHSSARETTSLGLAFLGRALAAEAPARVFLWLHYFDVHEHHQMQSDDPRLRTVLGEGGRPSRAAKYRATVQLVDAELGRLRQELEARGLWDRTIVILVSDHGESLGEDPRLPDTHGRFLYNPLVHVPLLVRVPGLAPAIIDTPVSLIDVAPTVLALAGGTPLANVDGESLVAELLAGTDAGPPAGALPPPRPIALNESEQRGVIDWPHKLLIRPADNLIELYDLARDPGETHNLAAQQPELVARLKSVYQRFPAVIVDRTSVGRQKRDVMARPPSRAIAP